MPKTSERAHWSAGARKAKMSEEEEDAMIKNKTKMIKTIESKKNRKKYTATKTNSKTTDGEERKKTNKQISV